MAPTFVQLWILILTFLTSTIHAYLKFQSQSGGGSRVVISDVSKINLIGSNSFTFSLWFKGEYSATYSGYSSLLSTRLTFNTGFIIGFHGSTREYTGFRPFLQLVNGLANYNASILYTDNQWYHLVIQRDNGASCTINYYVDGLNIYTFGPTNSTDCSKSIYLDSTSLRIGDDYHAEGWKGGIAELSIWNRSLNSSEIDNIYDNININENVLSLEGLLHYYPMNETSQTCTTNQVIHDIENGHDGILSNTTDPLCSSEGLDTTNHPISGLFYITVINQGQKLCDTTFVNTTI